MFRLSTEFQTIGFNITIVASYILYACVLFGVVGGAPKYLELLKTCVSIYVCLFLIIRFNPFRKRPSFNELDRKIAYNAGIFILMTTGITSIAIYFKDIKQVMANL